MLLFTYTEIEELMGIIDRYQTLFITTNIGTNFLTEKEKRILRDSGVDIDRYKIGTVEEAFGFGMLAAAISDDRVKKMKYNDFKKFVKSKNFIPLNYRERQTLEYLKYQTFTDVKGLGSKIKSELSSKIVEQERILQSKFKESVRQSAISTVQMRGSVRDMISELGERTDRWDIDLGRIAEYTLHNAYEEGRACQLEREYGGDVVVYKDVYPGACKHCIKHYLTAGIGSQPKLFKLSELRANGSNIGRKTEDWKATLGPMHPHCRCTINELPQNYTWDEDKKKFAYSSKNIQNPKVKGRSKISVKIGTEEYFV